MKFKYVSNSDVKRHNEEDLAFFYSLCGKEDKAVLMASLGAQPLENLARLLCVALVLGFRGLTVLYIMGGMESAREKKFLQYLGTVAKDGPTIAGWLDDFVRNIPDLEYKVRIEAFWREERIKTENPNFQFGDLL